MSQYNKVINIQEVQSLDLISNEALASRLQEITSHGQTDHVRVMYGYDNPCKCYFLTIFAEDEHPLAADGNVLIEVANDNPMFVICNPPHGYVLTLDELKELFELFEININKVAG